MARIIGVEIPDQKKVGISLRYIYGIGPTTALEVCEKAGVDPQIRAKDLTDEQLSHLTTALQRLVHAAKLKRRRCSGLLPWMTRLTARRLRFFARKKCCQPKSAAHKQKRN